MPKVVIPLVSEYNTRGLFATTGKDARLINGLYVPVIQREKKSAAWYVEKRPGWTVSHTPGSSLSGQYVLDALVRVSSFDAGTNLSVIFDGTANCGTISGDTVGMTDFTWGNTTYVMINTQSNATSGGWYLGENASLQNLTFTGSITSGQKTISGVASTTGVYVGQLLTQAALTAGTRIASISGTDVITDTNAISTTAAATITKQPVSKITDADFPTNGSYCYAELNGYVFVMDTTNRRIYQSDLNAVHSWGASNYITVDSAVGELYGIVRYKSYIVAICSAGLQFFFYNGNLSGSVLSSSPQATVSDVGGAAQASDGTAMFVAIRDNIYWLSYDRYGGQAAAVYTLDGFTPKKISTPAVENILTQATSMNAMGCLTIGGKYLIYVSELSNSVQLFYDIDSGKWVEAGFAQNYRVDSYLGVSTGGRGVVYEIEKGVSSYQDASTTYTLTVQTPRINFGTNNRKRIKKVSLIADNQASGSAYLSWTTDDYGTFSATRTLDMTANEKSARNLGAARNWAFRVIHYDNTAFRAEGLEIEYDVLDN